MALRLVRQTSDTPNITNKDDTIMTRYAYGGYNGVVKGYGRECDCDKELLVSGIFKILDGEIIIDGWEIQIDASGWLLDLSKITGTQYHSVYAEINVATESIKLDSTYLETEYPVIDKGDDLTAIPNGTARVLLYEVKVENGIITEVNKRFKVIPYLEEIETRLNNADYESKNAYKVNNLEIKKDNNGLLRIGDIIIPQNKVVWQGSHLLNNSYAFKLSTTSAVDKFFKILYTPFNNTTGRLFTRTFMINYARDGIQSLIVDDFSVRATEDKELVIGYNGSAGQFDTYPTILAIYEVIE